MNQEELKIQNTMNQINNQLPPTGVNTTFTECPQCGLIHPPLKAGEKCPSAPVIIKSEDGEKVNVNKFLVSLKNIIISQIEQKKIKDPEKLFKHIIIEMVKALEKYEE